MKNKNPIFSLLAIIVISVSVVLLLKPRTSTLTDSKKTITKSGSGDVSYEVKELVSGLDHPWGIDFLPAGDIIFTQRVNKITIISDSDLVEITPPEDTFVNGEGGMLDVVVDPEFSENSYIYLCFNSNNGDGGNPKVVVARFNLDLNDSKLTNRVDIIPDLPANPSGRHSGCRLEFDPEGYLWIGTGDTAQYEIPQDTKSLGGKVLRIDRDGNSVDGNLGGDFDSRIYSYGHRNIQGLGFFTNEPYKELIGISIEHGSDRDDEVNLLKKGNFGWDPLQNYGESVPMTDTVKFPDAIEAIWKSGYPTIAASGGTVINSDKWGDWQNSIVVAALKGSHVRVFQIDPDGKIVKEETILKNQYGRIRTVQESPDGKLYLLTDNGGEEDKILVLEPR